MGLRLFLIIAKIGDIIVNAGTITSDPCARANAAGTSGGTSLTVGDVQGTFADGDLILIHQTIRIIFQWFFLQ